jgi:hypothetical protein
VDDLAPEVMRPSGVLKRGLGILSQGVRSGVVLVRSPSLAGARHSDSKACVATFAKIAKVIGRPVRLVAVDVVHHEKTR